VLGGVGIAAMNGPAVMFCALVAIGVSTASAFGNTPLQGIPDHRSPLRNRCGLVPRNDCTLGAILQGACVQHDSRCL